MSSARANWRALLALTSREWRVLAAAVIFLPLTRVALRLFGYRRVERVLERLVPLQKPSADPELVGLQTARMVSVAAGRAPIAANCLPRSLVLRTLLHAQGVETSLRFGFRKDAGGFAAHAWVERLGVPLNDTSDVGELFEVVDIPPS